MSSSNPTVLGIRPGTIVIRATAAIGYVKPDAGVSAISADAGALVLNAEAGIHLNYDSKNFSVAEEMTLSDLPALLIVKSLTSSATLSDTYQLGFGVNPSNTLTLADQATIARNVYRTYYEYLLVTDLMFNELDDDGVINADTINSGLLGGPIREFPNVTMGVGEVSASAATLSDSQAFGLIKVLADSITLDDDVGILSSFGSFTMVNASTLADTIAAAVGTTIADGESLADTPAILTNPAFTASVSLADVASSVNTFARTFDDTLTPSDEANMNVGRNNMNVAQVTLTDEVTVDVIIVDYINGDALNSHMIN